MEIIKQNVKVKETLKDILLDVSWAKIAQKYFGKSPSWIYNKIDGIDDKGVKKEFTDDELEHFKVALFDFSERIRQAASKL